MTVTHINQPSIWAVLDQITRDHPSLPAIYGTTQGSRVSVHVIGSSVSGLLRWADLMTDATATARAYRDSGVHVGIVGRLSGVDVEVWSGVETAPEEFGLVRPDAVASSEAVEMPVERLWELAAGLCAYCGQEIPTSSPSSDYCGETCQRLWNQGHCDFEGEHLVQLPERAA